MKKVFSLLAVLAVTVFMASSVYAALPVAQKAYATFAAEELSVGFELYAHQDGKEYTFGTGGNYTTTVNDIQFDVSNVAVGTADSSFAKGTVFARVTSNLNKQKAGTTIYMFTKNSTASGNYQAKAGKVDSSGVTTYSGLIRKGNTATYAPGDHAALEMHFAKVSEAYKTYPTDMSLEATDYGDKYMVDKANSDFGTGAYAIIGTSGVGGGIWVGQESGVQHYVSEDVIVFIGARFDNVSAGDEYGTECINIQTTTE